MDSNRNGTRYIGVTSSVVQLVWQHKKAKNEFTGRHEVFELIFYEPHASMKDAIESEKQMKERMRLWKLRLIEKLNPEWNNLWPEILNGF